MQGRLSTVVSTAAREGITNRWPHVGRFLRGDDASGWVDDYLTWHFATEDVSLPSAEVAAAYEEWADFYEWRLTQRAEELADDRVKRHLVEKWTDSMAYCCRRSAAVARGDDPGEWAPQRVRRPDLDAESRAIVAEIIAKLDAQRSQPVRTVDRRLRRSG